MAKTKKVLQRQIFAEVMVGGAHYSLCSELHPKYRMSIVLRHQARAATGDRRNRVIWRKYLSKYKWHYDRAKEEGHKILQKIAIELIDSTQTVFRVRHGSGPEWSEVRAGDAYQDSVSTWRQRAKALFAQRIGDWEPFETNNQPPQNQQ
jgi:hypothetical protein